jgi:hypothetical protein
LLRRQAAPFDRIVLHRLSKADEEMADLLRGIGQINRELSLLSMNRRSEHEALIREIKRLHEGEKKPAGDGTK